MKCIYCYNPEIVFGKGVFSYEDILEFLKKRKGLLDGVVFSGGECTNFKDLIPFLEKVKNLGFKIKIDTNGLRPDVIEDIYAKKIIDYIALDFKTLDVDFLRITKTNHFSLFERTLDFLLRSNLEYEVRTTIHSHLISEKDLQNMIWYLELKGYNKPYYLQPFRNNVTTIQTLPNSFIPFTYKQIQSDRFPIVWRN